MDKLQGTFKLRVKIGEREFEAEGQPDVVAARFEEFRAIAEGTIASIARPTHAVQPPSHPSARGIFRLNPNSHTISLRIPPQGEDRQPNAALLILWGYHVLRGEEEVAVTRITDALRQSGVPVARLDRVLGRYSKQQMVLKAGQGKGGRYRLTNQGLARAEALAQELASLVE